MFPTYVVRSVLLRGNLYSLLFAFFWGVLLLTLTHPHTYHIVLSYIVLRTVFSVRYCMYIVSELGTCWNMEHRGVYGRGPPALYTSVYLLQNWEGDWRVRTFLGFLGFSVNVFVEFRALSVSIREDVASG